MTYLLVGHSGDTPARSTMLGVDPFRGTDAGAVPPHCSTTVPFCFLGDELELLQAPPEPTCTVAFVAPFDSLLWDNSLIGRLFDFDYVWEGFFPPAKRRWGR